MRMNMEVNNKFVHTFSVTLVFVVSRTSDRFASCALGIIKFSGWRISRKLLKFRLARHRCIAGVCCKELSMLVFCNIASLECNKCLTRNCPGARTATSISSVTQLNQTLVSLAVRYIG